MALPLIAAGIAARAIASKLATRAVGGITGVGAKTVAPVYRNQFTAETLKRPSYTPNNSLGSSSVKVVKPTSDINRKSLNAIEQQRVSINKSGVMAKGTAAPIAAKNAKRAKVPTIKINSK